MKYNNFMKKLAAVVTVVAMIASLGMTAFAANVMVEDYAKANALDITGVDAVYSLNGEIKNYTITVTYTGAASTDQVTVLGYLYDETDAELTAVPAESAIYAVNQEDGSGTTVIKLTSDTESAKYVAGTETLIIKMGSDADGITAAQAVRISLADAELQQAPLVVTSVVAPTDLSIEYGADGVGLKAYLDMNAPTVSVTGTRDEAPVTENVTVNWEVDESLVINSMTPVNVTGTLVGVDESSAVKTVTASVAITPLAGAVAAELTVNVPVDTADGDIEALIKAKALGLKLSAEGEEVDTIKLNDATVSEISIDLATVGNEGSAKVTVSGTSVKGIFALTDFEATVKLVAVEAAPDVIYGDLNGDEKVNMQDVAVVLKAAMKKTVLDDKQTLAADVNGDSKVNMQDVASVLKKAMKKLDKFPVED